MKPSRMIALIGIFSISTLCFSHGDHGVYSERQKTDKEIPIGFEKEIQELTNNIVENFSIVNHDVFDYSLIHNVYSDTIAIGCELKPSKEVFLNVAVQTKDSELPLAVPWDVASLNYNLNNTAKHHHPLDSDLPLAIPWALS